VNQVLDMVKGKARAAGSFLGGLANNPAIVIIALVLGGLFIFRDRISGAIGGLGAAAVEGIGDINIQLPEIKLPEIKLPDITFPEFKFPEFKFPDFNIFGGDELMQPQKMVEDTGLDPLSTCQCGASIVQDAFGNVNVTCKQCAPTPTGTPTEPFRDAAIFAEDFPEQFVPIPSAPPPDPEVKSFLTEIQEFEGGGLSFIGGSVSPTPIEFLSLSQIIDMFNVSASKAADIRAQAIGFTPEEELFLQGSGDIVGFTGFNPPAVSDQQFQGLTPQQIAFQLTGGNISNF